MNAEQRMVAEFHRAFDVRSEAHPVVPDEATRTLRLRLMDEELDEVRQALEAGDLPGLAKELADLLYVVYGTAVSSGIDLEPVFAEVHRSNMTKVGGTKRADGKWLKPSTYSPADVAPILEVQAPPCGRADREP